MDARFAEKAANDYAAAPVAVRKAFLKQLGLLLANLRHPFPARQEVQRSGRRLAGLGQAQLAFLLHNQG